MEWIDSVFNTNIMGTFSENTIIFTGAFIYNALYMIPSMILCVLVGIIIYQRKILQFNLVH
jgi:membrane protein DedA with SNARE-associated domain